MNNISAWAIRHPVPPIVLFVVLLALVALLVVLRRRQGAEPAETPPAR